MASKHYTMETPFNDEELKRRTELIERARKRTWLHNDLDKTLDKQHKKGTTDGQQKAAPRKPRKTRNNL